MNEVLKRAEKIKEIAMGVATDREAKSQIEDIDFALRYAEPGYEVPESGVVALGDWSKVTKWNEEDRLLTEIDDTPARVARIFEKLGIKLEGGDEWSSCNSCYGIVRHSPDSYGWTPSYHVDDVGLTCVSCLQENAADYLEELEGQPNRCNSIAEIHPSDYDYILIEDDFERGMHPGQDVSPQNIAKLLEAAGCKRYLFNLDGKGQFDIMFSVWLHKDEEGLLTVAKEALDTGKVMGPSVSAAAQRGLHEASRQQAELEGPGIKYSKIDVGTGTVETKLIKEEDL